MDGSKTVTQHNRHVIEYLFSLPIGDRLAAYLELIEHRTQQHDQHVVAWRMFPQHKEHVWEFRQLKPYDAHVEAYRVYMRRTWGQQCSHVHAYYADILDGGPTERQMALLLKPLHLSSEEKAARDRASEEELLAFERSIYGPFWYVERNRDPAKQTVGSEWLSAKAKAQGGNLSKSGDAAPKKRTRKSRKKPVFWSPKKAN